MVRFWLRLTVLGALAVGSFGCSGQVVEGAWEGDFTLDDAKACSIRLDAFHRFQLNCGGDRLVAAGSYRWNGRSLAFTFIRFARSGRELPAPNVVTLDVEGHGNTIVVSSFGRPLTWHRRAQ